MLLAVIVVGGLLIQLRQAGNQPAPTAPASAPAASQPPPAAPTSSSTPAPRPGEGPLRTTDRVLQPSYTVAPGDTLGTIAARFGTTVEALQSINNLQDRNVLSVGQKLVIPNQE